MKDSDNLGSFMTQSGDLLREYLDTRLEIYRLLGIRSFARSAGFLLWIVIAIFLLFLILIFAGLVTGFWLSGLTGSYVLGFGISCLILVVLFVLLALLRKVLFVNPIIRSLLRKSLHETEKHPED